MNKFLGKISSDFIKVANQIQESSYLMNKEGYKNPIFILSREALSIAPLLIKARDYDNQWNYHAAYLDLLIKNKIIDEKKEEEFQKSYKDPEEFCCMLIIDKEFTGFIYMPYPIDE